MTLSNKTTDSFIPKSGKKISGFASTIWNHFAGNDMRNVDKKVARLASWQEHQVSHHTARAWRRGKSLPCGETIVTLMAKSPEFQTIILELVEQRRCQHGLTSSNLASAGLDAPGD